MYSYLFIALLLADLVTTSVGLGMGQQELNPVAHAMGIDAFMAIKVVASAAASALAWRMRAELSPSGVKVLCILLAIVSLSNAIGVLSG